jgi:hypothetical protein
LGYGNDLEYITPNRHSWAYSQKERLYRNESVLYAMVLVAGTIVHPENESKTVLLMPHKYSLVMTLS